MGGCACRDCRRGLDDAERKKQYDCDVTQGSTSTAAAATNAMKVSTLTAAKPYSHLTLLAALQSWVIARVITRTLRRIKSPKFARGNGDMFSGKRRRHVDLTFVQSRVALVIAPPQASVSRRATSMGSDLAYVGNHPKNTRARWRVGVVVASVRIAFALPEEQYVVHDTVA